MDLFASTNVDVWKVLVMMDLWAMAHAIAITSGMVQIVPLQGLQ
jgi:hypothetical protein